MAKHSNVVRVPKPKRSSFDMKRPLAKNSLLENQVKHFHEVETKLAPEHRSGVDVATVQTEGAAAEYIRSVTTKLHQPAGPTKTQKRK